MANTSIKAIKDTIKKNRFLALFLLKTIRVVYRNIACVFRLRYGLDAKAIVFQSWLGNRYSDNPRAISEAVYDADPSMKIIWLFRDPEAKRDLIPSYVTCIRCNSWQAFRALSTSKYWVDNTLKSNYVVKHKFQIYIQTWHGDRGFKKSYFDQPDENPVQIMESKHCNYFVSGSSFSEKVYRTSLRFEGDFLPYGSPRNDRLLNQDPEEIRILKETLSIANKKVLLFAPTFRNVAVGQKQTIPGLHLLKIISALQRHTSNTWVCLVRSHGGVRGLEGVEYSSAILDVSSYEDMADLLLITDLLITDYSSSAGDFILTNKPVILFQPDYEAYVSDDRELYFSIEDSGFHHVSTEADLLKSLQNVDNISARNKSILDFYGAYETGEAAKLIAKHILNGAQ